MTHFLQRSALILFATTALCACSSTGQNAGMHPNFPIRTPPATPAPPPAATVAPSAPVETDMPRAQPSNPVESKPLESLTPAQPAPIQPAPAAPEAIREPAPVAAPSFRTVSKKTVTGRVVDVDGPAKTYEIKKGDNLQRAADKLGTSVEQLAKDNGLKKPYVVHPGDTLKGPHSDAKAYVVGQGDTLFAVARRFSVSAEALRQENDLGRNAALRGGQRLRLPDGYRDKGPTVTTSRVEVPGATEAAPAPRAVSTPAWTPAPVREPSRPAATEPSFRTVTTRSVTGRVITVDGPAVTYTVKSGDNLEKIARKLDTTVDRLKDDNGLKKSAIQPGQKLKGPRTSAKAYVAGDDDTLAEIGKRFGVTVEALRAENGLSRRAGVRAGQKLRLPDGYRDRGALRTTERIAIPQPAQPVERPVERTPEPVAERPVERAPERTPEPTPATPSQPRPYNPLPNMPRQATPTPATPRPYTPPAYTPPPARQTPPSSSQTPVGAPVSAAPLNDSQVSQAGRGRFAWPVRGDVISAYGPKAGGQRNDGVNIRANTGDAVRAAASGDVVYAGDQVPGFGNLVLIKHADGWVTAYGHLSRVDVKMQQKVTQGQQIGQAGSTGGVPEPQLHFEVRYAPSPLERARPVDPSLVLPR